MFSVRSSLTKSPAGQKRCAPVQAVPDRRAMLAGLVVGVASVTGKASAYEVTPVDLFDDRKRAAKSTGYDIADEARDLDLPQNIRDGISQFRGDMSATKTRFRESSKRIQGPLGGYINKGYWSDASNELHNQVGNFRADIRTIVSSMGTKESRREGNSRARTLLEACEDLDFAIQRKDKTMATDMYAKVNAELKSFSSFALG